MDTTEHHVRRAQQGDPEAYGEIVRGFQDMAVGYAYSLLRDFHLAEDAAQEAFVHAYEQIGDLREPAAFPGWFRRIVFKFADRIRRRQRATTAIDLVPEPAADTPTPEDDMMATELRDKVLAAVEQLPDAQRITTTLFYISEYSQEEIGEFLGVPINTVKTRLHRSRQRLTEGILSMVSDSLQEHRPSRDEAFLRRVQRDVAELRRRFEQGDDDTRQKVAAAKEPGGLRDRFEDADPDTLSEYDARVIVAMDHGFAHWDKLDAYAHLDPAVRGVIEAIGRNDYDAVAGILDRDPSAANPKWVQGYLTPENSRVVSCINDCMPLARLAHAVFTGKVPRGEAEYALGRALLDAGADPDYFDGYPLVSACSFNAVGTARALLEAGAEVDGVHGDGAPMAYVLFFGFTELAEMLAAQGARLDLRFAAGVGDLERVKSFHGVDGSLRPGAGDLADPYAHEHRQRQGTPHRCERTPENILSQALLFAALHGRLEVVECLIEHGADVNRLVPGTAGDDATVLHRLCATGNFDQAQDLKAVEHRRLGVVDLLLSHGADVTIRDTGHHSTPLGWAGHFGCEDIAARLRQHGAVE